MASLKSQMAGLVTRRTKSLLLMTAVLTSTFLVMAMSQQENQPQSEPGPTATILSPFAVLDPSTGNNPNDKDGFPPTKSEADPEEAFLVGMIAVPETVYGASATLAEYPQDAIHDLMADDDSPRNLDTLDGTADGMLAAGTYFVYWNLNKTGYVPVNTTPGSSYNGSNSASVSIVDDTDGFQLNMTYSETEGGTPVTVSSSIYTITMWKSSSIGQNDLEWLDTEPKVVFAQVGDLFTVRSKYQQSSAQGLDWLILQSYFNGQFLRMRSVSLYFYNNRDPGSVNNSVPAGWDNVWNNQQQFAGADLGETDNKDFWVTEYTFEIRQLGFSDLIPYIQTKKGGDTWKVDTGYRGFRSRVPGGINPAVLGISKYFSENYVNGVVSGPDPPVVGMTTTYEINITVGNSGGDTATSVVVTDVAQLDNVSWLGVVTLSKGSFVYDPLTGTLTWTVGSLVANETATLNYRVSVTPTPEMAGKTLLLNSGASATGKSKTSGETLTAGPTPPLYTEPVVGIPIMMLTKTADRNTVNPGDEITYTLQYENVGSGTAYNVVIQDTIPDHVTYVSSSPTYDSMNGDQYSWIIGQVAAGASGNVTITVQVNVGTQDGTVLMNLGRVTYTDQGGEEGPPGGSGNNVTVTSPIMTFSKTADLAAANPGDLIIYTLSYANIGNGTATGVIINDTLPDYVTFISSTPAPTDVNGRVYTFDIGSVSGGSSGSVEITVQVDAGTPDKTVLTNLATIDYDDANGNPYPQQTDDANTTATSPVVTFEKTADPTTANPGDLIYYTLTTKNTGTGAASDVVLKDTIPDHTTFFSSNPPYTSKSGRTYTWELGTLAPGQTKTVTLEVTVDAYTADGVILNNTATLDYADVNGNDYPQLSDSVTTTVTAPIMDFAKTADVSYADPGDIIKYTITYVNTGTGKATNVAVTDTIPEHVSYVSSSPLYSQVNGRTYTWDIGEVDSGGGGTIILKVMVDAGTADTTLLTNTAHLDYADANGNPYPELTSDASTTVTAPVMTFSKSADVTEADPGDVIIYTLHYKNEGTGKATGVVVTDTIPAHTTYVSSSPHYSSVNGATYTWNVGTVAAGAEDDIILKVTVDAGTADTATLLNTATLDHNDANGNPYAQLSDEATVTVTAPVMTFDKEADVTTADPGDVITYTLTYHNAGTGLATNVIVTDTIPEHVTYQDSNPLYTDVSGRKYTWEIGDVAADGGGTITLKVKVDAGTADQILLANVGTLDYDDANSNPLDQLTSTATTTVTAPVMSFSKVADVAYADPGDLIEYTLSYKNSGTGVATGVEVRDTIPVHVTYVSSTPSYTNVSGRTYTWDVGDVGAGVSGTIVLTVKVDAGTADKTVLTNTATFDYSDANGNPYPQKDDSATTTVTAPVMTFMKVADVNVANPGDIVTYTLSYENSGTGSASFVVITDTLPDHVTFVNATPYPDSISGNVLDWEIGDVLAGTEDTISIEVKVDLDTPDGALLHNAATLDYADPNGNSYPQLTASYDVTTAAPVMSFAKSADVTTADPGDSIVFTLHYENSGSGAATSIVVVDTLPSHVTFVDATPYPDSISGNVLTWNIQTVGPRSNGDITVMVEVVPYTEDGTYLVNDATFDYKGVNGNPYPQLSDEAQVTVTAPIMHMSKLADVQTADPGDEITYKISYYNSGSGEATGVVINDTIPDFVTYVSSTPQYDSVDGRTYEWDIGSVAGGAEGTIYLVVMVDISTPDATLLHNVATLDYADANGNYYPQLSDDADVTVTAPVVSLTKTADVTTADPSDFITYTIKFTNSGSGNATSVYVNDTIPLHVAFISSTPDYLSVDGRTYTWYWALVEAGSSVTVEIVVQVDAYTNDQTLLHNFATTDYNDDNGNPYPQIVAYADVTVTAPVFTFYKSADVTTADPGDTVIYTIDWHNTGTGWASGVTIKDTLPSYVEFVSSTPGYSDVNGMTYTWDLGDVAPDASGQITITVTVTVGAPDQTLLHNVATLDYSDANGNAYPQMSDYADVSVTAPVMTFEKMGDVTTADPGDYITYTLTYKNIGTGVASNVVVVDNLPADVTFVDSTPAPTSQVGQTLTWDVDDFAPGTGIIIVTVQVTPGTPDKTLLHNTATFDYADANGNAYPQLSSYWDVQVTAPVISFSKNADVSTANPGDEITYTLDYENSGSGNAGNVTIVDTLPADVEFVSASRTPDSIVGNVLIWNLGFVDALTNGSITVYVKVTPGTPDKTLLHNVATLDYSDANDNFIEQLSGSADTIVTAPVMTLEKDAGNVTVFAYVMADFELRIAGEKWHDVILTLYDGNTSTAFASVTRYPGSPDEQAVTLYNVRINLLDSFRAIILYTPPDDPINGAYPGDNPCWLTLNFTNGDSVRLKHNFNVNHIQTWVWIIDDFRPYIKGQTITYEGDIPYSIFYENTGTGDASNVVITDTFQAGSIVLDSNPPYDSCNGNVCTWNIGDVASGQKGYIFVNISYIFGVNNTVVTNEAALDYSDVNGNFIERLHAYARSILILPELFTGSPGDAINFESRIGLTSDLTTPEVTIDNGASSSPVPAIIQPSEPVQPQRQGVTSRAAAVFDARSSDSEIVLQATFEQSGYNSGDVTLCRGKAAELGRPSVALPPSEQSTANTDSALPAEEGRSLGTPTAQPTTILPKQSNLPAPIGVNLQVTIDGAPMAAILPTLAADSGISGKAYLGRP